MFSYVLGPLIVMFCKVFAVSSHSFGHNGIWVFVVGCCCCCCCCWCQWTVRWTAPSYAWCFCPGRCEIVNPKPLIFTHLPLTLIRWYAFASSFSVTAGAFVVLRLYEVISVPSQTLSKQNTKPLLSRPSIPHQQQLCLPSWHTTPSLQSDCRCCWLLPNQNSWGHTWSSEDRW